MCVGGKRGRSAVGKVTPLPYPLSLTDAQTNRYTEQVLRRKGYHIDQRGTNIKQYWLVPPDGSAMEPVQCETLDSAVKVARETSGLVSEDELRELYEVSHTSPWPPHLAHFKASSRTLFLPRLSSPCPCRRTCGDRCSSGCTRCGTASDR